MGILLSCFQGNTQRLFTKLPKSGVTFSSPKYIINGLFIKNPWGHSKHYGCPKLYSI